MSKKISGMDPKGSALGMNDLLEIAAYVSMGAFQTKNVSGQNIKDGVLAGYSSSDDFSNAVKSILKTGPLILNAPISAVSDASLTANSQMNLWFSETGPNSGRVAAKVKNSTGTIVNLQGFLDYSERGGANGVAGLNASKYIEAQGITDLTVSLSVSSLVTKFNNRASASNNITPATGDYTKAMISNLADTDSVKFARGIYGSSSTAFDANSAILEVGGGASSTGAGGSAQLALSYVNTGAAKHFIETWHDTSIANSNKNKYRVWLANTTSSTGSTKPGTGNALALDVNIFETAVPYRFNAPWLLLNGTSSTTYSYLSYGNTTDTNKSPRNWSIDGPVLSGPNGGGLAVNTTLAAYWNAASRFYITSELHINLLNTEPDITAYNTNSELVFWRDNTSGAADLRAKIKIAAGTSTFENYPNLKMGGFISRLPTTVPVLAAGDIVTYSNSGVVTLRKQTGASTFVDINLEAGASTKQILNGLVIANGAVSAITGTIPTGIAGWYSAGGGSQPEGVTYAYQGGSEGFILGFIDKTFTNATQLLTVATSFNSGTGFYEYADVQLLTGISVAKNLFVQGTASCTANAWTTPSDKRSKTNVETLDTAQALESILKITPKIFDRTPEFIAATGVEYKRSTGYIADEIEAIPEFSHCVERKDRFGYSDFATLTPEFEGAYTIAAIKELAKQVAQIKEHLSIN